MVVDGKGKIFEDRRKKDTRVSTDRRKAEDKNNSTKSKNTKKK